MRSRTRAHNERGSAMVEFSIVFFLLLLVLFSVLEFCRMVLVANSIANAARAGTRYAVTHGSDRTGSGSTGPSGPGANPPYVLKAVQNFAGTAAINQANLSVTVSYPDTSNKAGSRVDVTVVYTYDPFTVLPVHVNLGSFSEGVITY